MANDGFPPPPGAEGRMPEGKSRGGGTTPLDNPGAVAAQEAAWSMSSPQADAQQQAANASSPQLDRLSTPQPPMSPDTWVTVPVDKVSVANGKGTVTPMYAAAQGYDQGPPPAVAIPPTPKAGRP